MPQATLRASATALSDDTRLHRRLGLRPDELSAAEPRRAGGV
jgi:hypothetical protein